MRMTLAGYQRRAHTYRHEHRLLIDLLKNWDNLLKESSMYSLNGFGTKLLGIINWNDDGSYDTVKWFVFFYIPILPLACYRVYKEDILKNSNLGISSSKKTLYSLRKIPMNWKYVLIITCVVYATIALIIFFLSLNKFFNGYTDTTIGYIGALISALIGGFYVAYKLQIIG